MVRGMENPLLRTDWELSRASRLKSARSSLLVNIGGAVFFGGLCWLVLGESGLVLALFLVAFGTHAAAAGSRRFGRTSLRSATAAAAS